MALEYDLKAAKILFRKGAKCTKAEILTLGKKYTNFMQTLQANSEEEGEEEGSEENENESSEDQEDEEESGEDAMQDEADKVVFKSPRAAIRRWMDNEKFAKLQQCLEISKNQLEALIAEGEMPVVGWLQLAEKIKTKDAYKRVLEAELDENARQREQLAAQITDLLQKQQELEEKNQQLQKQMAKAEEIAKLEAESETIAILSNKEAASLAKVEERMKSNFFMDEFDAEDVSTVFSMFKMDHLFTAFKISKTSNLEEAASASVADLQNRLQIEFPEALEMLFKLKLFENGEKGVDQHLAGCSICASKNVGVLLREYGMTEDERKEIEENIKDWKGYFLVVASTMGAASALELPAGTLRSKLASCMTQIKRVHKWRMTLT